MVTTTCQNGGFTVATFGELLPNVCGILGRYPETPGTYRIVVIKPVNIDNFGGFFYQSGANWVQLVFAQTFKAPWGSSLTLEKNQERYESTNVDGTMTLRSPFLGPLMDSDTKNRVWPIGNGVAASYREGARAVLPPGWKIVTADGLCTQIKTYMDPLTIILLTAKGTPPPTPEKIAASFKEFGCPTKDRSVPIVGLLLLFGLPLALIAGIVFGVRRFLRRRRGAYLPEPPRVGHVGEGARVGEQHVEGLGEPAERLVELGAHVFWLEHRDAGIEVVLVFHADEEP